MQPAFCFYAGRGWGFRNVDKKCLNVDLCCITHIYFVPLLCLRISGNAEERPPNVKTTLRQGRRYGVILTAAFLFTIISQSRTFNLAYCLLFERFT